MSESSWLTAGKPVHHRSPSPARGRRGTTIGTPEIRHRSDGGPDANDAPAAPSQAATGARALLLGLVPFILGDEAADIVLTADLTFLRSVDDLLVLLVGDHGNFFSVAVDDLAVLDGVTLVEDGLIVE